MTRWMVGDKGGRKDGSVHGWAKKNGRVKKKMNSITLQVREQGRGRNDLCGAERKHLEHGTEIGIKGLVKTLQMTEKESKEKDMWRDLKRKLQPAAAHTNCWDQMCISVNCDKRA